MVLCPFVYLMMRHDLPPLALQPLEIHSTHWVPIRALLSVALRRPVYTDASDRFTRQRQPLVGFLLWMIAGQMRFGAVKLKPTESLYCSFHPDDVPNNCEPESPKTKVVEALRSWFIEAERGEDEHPLLL